MKQCLLLLLLILCSSALVFSQATLRELNIEKDDNSQSIIYKGCSPDVGVIVFYTTIPDLKFSLPDTPSRLKNTPAFDREFNCYVLCLQPTDTRIGGIMQYSIAVTASGYKPIPAFMISDIKPGIARYFKITVEEDWRSAFESLKKEIAELKGENGNTENLSKQNSIADNSAERSQNSVSHVKSNSSDGIELVYVEGSEGIKGFYIGKYEITQAQWVAIMAKNPSKFKGASRPVDNVSLNDAQNFIAKLNAATGWNYHLPTENEWIYAAKGGIFNDIYKYAGSDNIKEVAWYNSRNGGTREVGTKAPNSLGIFDMSGNVWEWCQDGYPRGGSWNNDAINCSVTSKSLKYDAGKRDPRFGFRIVLDEKDPVGSLDDKSKTELPTQVTTTNELLNITENQPVELIEQRKTSEEISQANPIAPPSTVTTTSEQIAAELVQQADNIFNNRNLELSRFERSFQLYKNAKEMGGDVTTGYINFLSTALSLIEIGAGFDGHVILMLQYAQQLNDTREIRDLLAKSGQSIQHTFTTTASPNSLNIQNTQRHPAEPEMVFVEGGTFWMGCIGGQKIDCSQSKNTKKVTVSSFYIGVYEVTQGQWKAIMGRNPAKNDRNDNYPIEQVNWNDVQEFLVKLTQLTGKNYRLPTEAEWEYAARGGKKSQGYTYSGSSKEVENVAVTGKRTQPVGTKRPNELDIHDMSGNVWEWCQDWSGTLSGDLITDPQGPSSGSRRIFRGGCYNNLPNIIHRADGDPRDRDRRIGFRVALSM